MSKGTPDRLVDAAYMRLVEALILWRTCDCSDDYLKEAFDDFAELSLGGL